jgi:hypothetical protein
MNIEILDTVNKFILVNVSGSPSPALDFTAAWVDVNVAANTLTEVSNDGTCSSGSTAVVSAPASGHTLLVKELTLQNSSGSSVSLAVQFVNNTSVRNVWKGTLAVNNTWSMGAVFDSTGALSVGATGPAGPTGPTGPVGPAGGGGDFLYPLTAAEISITTTATATLDRMHVCSGTSANYTVTLPTAVGNAGKLIGIRMSNALTKLITLHGNSTETIDGTLTRIMHAGESCVLLSDGTGWCKISGKSLPFMAMITASSVTTIPPTTPTKVTLSHLYNDTYGMVADTANSKLIIPRPSTYKILISLTWNGNGWSGSQVRCHKNGSLVFNFTASIAQLVDSLEFTLSANDYLELFAYNGDSLSHDVYQDSSPGTSISITEIPQW